MAYRVSTPAFEGPIDLLAHLVRTHEVDVRDIELAPIVDGFLAVLVASSTPEEPGEPPLPIDVLSEFLLFAAILVELKSQRLLPEPEVVDDDEELVGWEQRDLLISRLLECRAYAGAADVFSALVERAALCHPRDAGLDDGFVVHAPDLLAGVTADHLAQAYLRSTAERPEPRVDLSHVTVDTVTVAETVRRLVGMLEQARSTTFGDLTRAVTTRIDVIVHFLAVLELCKLGKVSLGQGRTFGELQITWVGGGEADLVGVGAGLLAVDDYDG